MRSRMNLQSAKRALGKLSVAVLSISLLVTRAQAQSIGHLGVSADPIPLAQAKRPQPKYLARNVNRNRPDPSSPSLRADVSSIGGASGVNQKSPATNPAPSSPVVVAENKPQPSVAPTTPANSTKPSPANVTKPAAPTFEDHMAKAAESAAKGDASSAASTFRAALSLKPDSLEAHLGL